MSVGRRMGHVGEGANIAGLFGIQDPAASLVVNQLLQPILTGYIGGNYVPAQFSAGGNLYSQIKMGNTLKSSSSAMSMAAHLDQKGIYDTIRGSARLMGQPFGVREQAAASELAGTIGSFVPMMAQYNPDLVDKLYGVRGSATVMAQNMFKGGRYAIDPTTGRRGYSAETAAEVTKGIYERLYGDNADISQMSGVTAGKAGQLFDEMQRRGMMPNTTGRTQGLKEIADQMGTTVAEVSNMPDLDRKLRELDANKISDKLKGMSRAVSAMQEIFGEMGETDAPMSQLVGAIETLTQTNMQNMDPLKLERMIRTTSATAKAAGIEMPEMMRSMGATAAYADRAGVNRALVQGLDTRAVIENQAMKNIYGGVQGFGVPSADKLADASRQLMVQSARNQRTYEVANIARAVEQYGVRPEAGSELEAVYNAIKNPESRGEYEFTDKDGNKVRKNITDIMKQTGGINQFMLNQGVKEGVITNMLANRSGTEMFVEKYGLAETVGRRAQTEEAIRDTKIEGMRVISALIEDKNAAGDLAEALKGQDMSELVSSSVSEYLYNADSADVGDSVKTSNAISERIRETIKAKTGKDISQDDPTLKMLAGQMAGAADQYSQMRMNMPLAGAQMLLSKKVLDQAAADKAAIDVDVLFESKARDLGKTNIFQRMTDFVRESNQDTKVEDFLGSVFNYQKSNVVKERFGSDFQEVYAAAKGFSGYKAEDAKREFIKNAITVNQAALSDPSTSEADKQKLVKEADDLKKQLIDTGIDKKNVDKEFNAYVDMAKNENKGDLKAAAVKAKENLDTFQTRHGVTAEQARTMSLSDIKLSGKKYYLDTFTKLGEQLGMRLNAAGLVSEVSTNKEINQAVDMLRSSDTSIAGGGLAAARGFVNDYALSPDMMKKGGAEGLDLKNKAQVIMGSIAKAAKSLDISEEDLMAGKLPANLKGMDLESLKKEAEAEISVMKDLANASTDKAYEGYVAENNKRIAALEKKTDRSLEEEMNLRVYKKAAATDRRSVPVELELAMERKAELDKQTPADLKKAVDKFIDVSKQEKDHVTAIDKFVKAYNAGKSNDSEKLSMENLASIVNPVAADLKKVQDLREQKYKNRNNAEEVSRIDNEIKKVIEESGISATNFNVLKDDDRTELNKQLEAMRSLSSEERDYLKKARDPGGIAGKISAAEGLFASDKEKRLDQLEARSLAGKDKVDFMAEGVDAKNVDALKAKLNSYNSVTDVTNVTNREELANLANITRNKGESGQKYEERRDKQLTKLFESAKAEKAGILNNQAFVVEKGTARPATNAEIESGNFSYMTRSAKDGKVKLDHRKVSSIGGDKLAPGEADRFKRLSAEEEKELTKLKADRVSSDKALKGLDTEEVNKFRKLLIREKAPATMDEATKKELMIKGGFENESQLLMYESLMNDRNKAIESLPEDLRDKVRDDLKKGRELEVAKTMSAFELSKFDARALTGALGAEGMKNLTQESKRQLIETMQKLGSTVTSGGKPLTAAQNLAIKESSEVMTGDHNKVVNMFKDTFKAANLDKGALIGKATNVQTGAGLRQASSMLRMGMAEAGSLAGKDNNTPEQQAKALYNLLNSDDTKLSDQQKALKKNLTSNKITAEMFTKGADGSFSLDAKKIMALGDEFSRDMAKKNALTKESDGKVGTVRLESGTELKMSGTVNVSGGTSALVGIASTIINSFDKKN